MVNFTSPLILLLSSSSPLLFTMIELHITIATSPLLRLKILEALGSFGPSSWTLAMDAVKTFFLMVDHVLVNG